MPDHPDPDPDRTGYVPIADERRAAEWVQHLIHGRLDDASRVARTGPIHPLSVFRACEAAAPALWLDPETCGAQLDTHMWALFEHEHGLDDLGEDGSGD
ncbi:hypothetical protein ACFYVR_13480 [Rhodococcus sp. NPDC003318]|uniref:hypothetical protein n=1 Tax=Rhodococcus sp. NPDC003318 TaxID=3364503 RepID=UPI00368FCCEF